MILFPPRANWSRWREAMSLSLRRMQKYCGVGWWSWSENHTYLFKVFVFYVASLPDRHIFQWNIEKGRMFTAVRRVDKCPACSPGRRELFLEVCGQIPHSWDRRFLRRRQRPEVKFISGRRLTFRREAALSPRGRENSEFPVVYKTWVHFLLSCSKYLPFLSHLVSEGFKTNYAIYNWN